MSGGILSGLLGGVIGGDQAQMGNGILGNMNNYMTNNSGALLGFGAGMLAGDNAMAAQGAMQGMQQDQRTRLLKQAEADKERIRVAAIQEAQKRGIDPALAEANPDFVFRVAEKAYMPKELSFEERQFNALSPQQQAQYRERKFLNGGEGGYGLNPVYGTDANGNPVIMQIGKNGQAVQTAMPEGVKLSKEPIKLDAGTHFVLIDPISRQPVGTIPKDNAGAARDTELGKADGAAIAGAPNQLASAESAIGVIDQIKAHPGRESATGWQSIFPTANGSKAAGFENLVEQAKSGAFLTAVQQLRGLGAMSEYEAKSATAAINRMNVATSDADFLKAVEDYEKVVFNAKTRAEQIMARRGNSGGGTVPVGAPQAQGGGSDLKKKYGLE